jgi:N-methylhydantoinase B
MNLFDNGSHHWSDLPTKFTRAIAKGQAFRHTSAGGGGYGEPLERDPDLVLADVRNGKVSAAAAARDYGVAIKDQPWRIDAQATARLRETPRTQTKAKVR